MKDNKNFDRCHNSSSEDEHKKLVDKFLTIKEVPDKEKKKLHFEKMLRVFRSGEFEKSGVVEELSDEEIDLVSAAGISQSYEPCPYCGKLISSVSLEKHKLMVHGRI